VNSVVKNYLQVDDTQRDGLFEDNLSLVKIIAHHIGVRLPPGKDIEDLIQVGMIGLLEAAKSYQPRSGAEFKTYASIRIRGAILDELRRESWMPRSVQQKAQELSRAIQRTEHKLGRSATDREIAAELDVSLEEYGKVLESVAGTTVFSLEDEGSLTSLEEHNDSPYGNVQSDSTRKRLGQVIGGLPEQERLVVVLYYDKGLNLREIGEVLGLGESRVCQVHSQAVGRMRSRMRENILNQDI
jgi:RNA polymerase sigma factor for flagellar operon FliA